jgi:hypothetical protein
MHQAIYSIFHGSGEGSTDMAVLSSMLSNLYVNMTVRAVKESFKIHQLLQHNHSKGLPQRDLRALKIQPACYCN